MEKPGNNQAIPAQKSPHAQSSSPGSHLPTPSAQRSCVPAHDAAPRSARGLHDPARRADGLPPSPKRARESVAPAQRPAEKPRATLQLRRGFRELVRRMRHKYCPAPGSGSRTLPSARVAKLHFNRARSSSIEIGVVKNQKRSIPLPAPAKASSACRRLAALGACPQLSIR